MDDEYRDNGNRLIMNTHDSYEVNIPEGADAKKMTERVQESIRSRAVSYTHLDVYKRQSLSQGESIDSLL